MTRITGEIVIDAPADVVFDFVADQRNEPAYRVEVLEHARARRSGLRYQSWPGPHGHERVGTVMRRTHD